MTIQVVASLAKDIITYSHAMRDGGPLFYIEKALSQLKASFSVTTGKEKCIVEISQDTHGNDTGIIKYLTPIDYDISLTRDANILISTIGDELDLDMFFDCQNNLFIDLQGFIRVAGNNHLFAISNKFTFFKCTETEFVFMNKKLLKTSETNGNIYFIVTHGGKKIEVFNRNKCIFTLNEKKLDYIDTIGAGDTFFSSFVYYFSQGDTIKDSIYLASVLTQKFLKQKNNKH